MLRIAEELCLRRSDLLSQAERELLITEVLDEVFGLGPLEPLFNDPTISDILINGPHTVYVEQTGQLESSDVKFIDDAHVVAIVQRIAGQVGRRIDEATQMVDARLADGSRLNAIIPPLAIDGPLVSIRRFGSHRLTTEDLLATESVAPEILEFLISMR